MRQIQEKLKFMNTYPFLRVASVVESHDDAPQWYVLPLKKIGRNRMDEGKIVQTSYKFFFFYLLWLLIKPSKIFA